MIPGEVVRMDGFDPLFAVFVQGDSQYIKSLFVIFLPGFHNIRVLGPAGPAPGGPKIDQQHLSLQRGEGKGISGRIGLGEVGGRLSDLNRFQD